MLVFFLANVLPGQRGAAGPRPVRVDQRRSTTLNHQLGTDQPLITQYLDQMKGYLHGRHGDVGLDAGSPSRTCSGRRSGTRRSSRCSRSSSSCRCRSSAGSSRRCKRGQHARPDDHGRRPVGDGGPGLRLGRRPADRVLARPGDLPVDGRVARRVGDPHADQVPAPARVLPRVRAVRLHRAHGPRGDDRGARRGLHADRGPQGAAAAHGALAPRAAQLAAADDRRHRDAGRLPDGRPRRDRAHLQLPGDRPDDLPRGDAEGLPGARGGGARRRRRLPRRRRSIADILYSVLNPRVRLGSAANERRRHRARDRARRRRSPSTSARRATTRSSRAGSACRCSCARSRSSPARSSSASGCSARSSASCSCPRIRSPRDPLNELQAPSARPLVRHRPARPRRVLARHRRRARHHDRRAARDAPRHRPRHRARPRDRLLPRRGRRRRSAALIERSSRCRS